MAVKSQMVDRRTRQEYQNTMFSAAFRAGLLGGFAVSLLLIVHQLSFDFTPVLGQLLRNWLIPPFIAFVWMVTGIGAVMILGDRIRTSREGGRVGLIAGLVAGVIGGITAMIIAALGYTFVQYGQGLLSQFSETQLNSLNTSGFDVELVTLTGSVFSAMFACGFGGMVLAGVCGWFGGLIYPRFAR